MKRETIMCKIFNFSLPTYYKKKRNNNLAVNIIAKYFSIDNLIEFEEKNKIAKFELIQEYTYEDLKKLLFKHEVHDHHFYTNILFKLKDLIMREKAILYHSIKKFNPTNKDELLNSIKSLKLTKVLVDQFISIFKLQKKEHELDMKLGYSFDQDNLYKFIDDYISEEEVKAFLKKPKFD